jgi:hypothetical protein
MLVTLSTEPSRSKKASCVWAIDSLLEAAKSGSWRRVCSMRRAATTRPGHCRLDRAGRRSAALAAWHLARTSLSKADEDADDEEGSSLPARCWAAINSAGEVAGERFV